MNLQELIRKKGRSKRLYSQAHLPGDQSAEEVSPKAEIPQPPEVLKRPHQEKDNEEEKFIKLIKPASPERTIIVEADAEKKETVFPIENYIALNHDLTHSALMSLIDMVRLRKLRVQHKFNTKRKLPITLVSKTLNEQCALPATQDSVHNEKRVFCEVLKTRRQQVNDALQKNGDELLVSYLAGCASRNMLGICEKYKTKSEMRMEASALIPNSDNQTAATIIQCANCFDS
eukprot:TRINITY_DN5056_c0_g3_i1.p1 TRINITY_DN5056_c0_g3~~TRINITY_DN5056_c0_g3_i1.p1  ORF type:complete len:231 (+),score=61.41 TRINITY_DN5056_c0_g3_i1:96-788(+)